MIFVVQRIVYKYKFLILQFYHMQLLLLCRYYCRRLSNEEQQKLLNTGSDEFDAESKSGSVPPSRTATEGPLPDSPPSSTATSQASTPRAGDHENHF